MIGPAQLGDPATLCGLAAFVALVALVLRDLRGRSANLAVAGSSAAFAGGLILGVAFVAHVFTPLSVIYAERLFFLPSAFACWLGALGLAAVHRRAPRATPIVLVAVVLAQASAALPRTTMWRNDVVLNETCVTETPANVRCHLHLARTLRDRGRSEPALVHYALAALGRQAFPATWPALAAQRLVALPMQERFRALLPALAGELGAAQAPWLGGLARFLDGEPAPMEAALARRLEAASRDAER